MTDAIEFYLTVFREISTIYEDKAENQPVVLISEKLNEVMKKLKKENDSKAVENALFFVLSVFENYYSDDYNRIGIDLSKISDGDKTILADTLEKELFSEEISTALKNLSKNERELILDILKKEIS